MKLLIAVKRIERGKPIRDDAIAVREVPIAYVDDRAIRETEKNKILGLRPRQHRAASSSSSSGPTSRPATDERKELSSLVLPGLPRSLDPGGPRRHEHHAAHARGLRRRHRRPRRSTAREAKSAVVLLQRVLVLAIGQRDVARRRWTRRTRRVHRREPPHAEPHALRGAGPRARRGARPARRRRAPSRTIRHEEPASPTSTSTRSSTRRSAARSRGVRGGPRPSTSPAAGGQ